MTVFWSFSSGFGTSSPAPRWEHEQSPSVTRRQISLSSSYLVFGSDLCSWPLSFTLRLAARKHENSSFVAQTTAKYIPTRSQDSEALQALIQRTLARLGKW